MKNLNNYVETNLYTFKEKEFNELDSLVLSWFSYYHIQKNVYEKDSFKTIKIKELYNAKYFKEMTFDVFDIPSSLKLLSLLAASPRFRDIDIVYYVENTSKSFEKQFSAMTFIIDKNTYYVAYRGTDHSFIGWKEDLNMGFLKSIPSQIEAKDYLNTIMKKFDGIYYIGGHSKGGNLAIYASSFIDNKYQKRIKEIYSWDGPGLQEEHIESKEYKNISKLIKKFVPQSSLVGMIFEKTENYKIIKSNSIGVLQHSPFTWEIKNDKLITLKNSSLNSKNFKKSISALVNTLDENEIRLFSNTLYGLVENTENDTVEDMIKNINKAGPIILENIKKLTPEQKENLGKVSSTFLKETFAYTLNSIKKITDTAADSIKNLKVVK